MRVAVARRGTVTPFFPKIGIDNARPHTRRRAADDAARANAATRSVADWTRLTSIIF